MQAQLSVATQPPNSAFHPLHLSCTGTCNSVSTVFWSIFGTIRSIFSGRSAARRGVFRPPGRILAQKFVFCYRTTDFVNGPFVALDDIFDLAPSDRFLNFLNQESYRVPKKSGPRKKVFGHFLLLDGSIWTETMLYDQGISLRRSGYPTCLYSEKNWPQAPGTSGLEKTSEFQNFLGAAFLKR